MDTKLAQKAATAVQLFGALHKRAQAELAPLKSDSQKAAAARPDVLQALINAGTVDQDQSKEAEDMLATHAGTYTLLKRAAEAIKTLAETNAKRASEIGGPADGDEAGLNLTKDAGYDSLSSPIVGLRTADKKQSDVRYERALLG